MNYYAFIPLSAFIINSFTSTYIFSQKRGGAVNKAYAIYASFLALWMLELYILWLPIDESMLIYLEKITLTTSFIFIFSSVNFTYVFLKREKDHIYGTFFTLLILSSTIIVFTDLFINGYTKYHWGVTLHTGKLFIPIVLSSGLLPSLYSFFLINQERRKTKEINKKSQLSLFLLGSIIWYLLFFIFDFLIPHIFEVKNILRIGIPSSVFQSLFIFKAVNKYNFLSISIEEAANDLFTNIKDGIVLLDNYQNIIQINEEAKTFFNINNFIIEELRINNLIEDYNFHEDYKNYETIININNDRRIVSLSQATVKQYNVESGKILIIRDITDSKKAQEELQANKTELEKVAQALAQANASLEQKVAARTQSLLLSNEQLQREIQERTRAETELATEKERLTVTLESIGDGVITTDTVGNIVLLNKVAEQLTGWSAATAVGQPLMTVLRLVDEKTRVPRDNPVATALQNAEIVNRPQHSLLLAQDQNERLIADTIAPIRNQGQVIGAVLVFRDMTERRKFEEELTKADKLESISVLAGGLAHDFNNILTAILGNLSLAKMYADPEDKVFGRLLSAEKAAQQAQNLTRQLLTFSKGGLLVRTPSSIVDIVKDSIDLSLRGSNVKCDLLVQTDVWPVEVDTGQIVQVINNLIINADQAMPDGGRMEVRLENVEIHEEHHNILLPLQVGKYIKISFTDNGIGIPEDIMQKIFDPYFTTKKKGSGLGLFSCYSIIKKHDGHIAVESTPGVGTTFYVYLPASLQEVIAVQDRSEVRSVGTGYILIMEDEETIREVTGEMLSHFGYEVEFAPDGAAAIELYQRAKETGKAFDVVIMDLTIPGGMGGKEAVRHLLALDPQARVVVASGYANDPILTDFQHYGFCERIAKPYKAEELHVLLHRIITGTSP